MISRNFYLSLYSDVKENGLDPESHFEKYGIHEVRIPDLNSYYQINSEIRFVISGILKNKINEFRISVTKPFFSRLLPNNFYNFFCLLFLLMKFKKIFSSLDIVITEELEGGVNTFLTNHVLAENLKKNFLFLVPDKFSSVDKSYFKMIFQIKTRTYVYFFKSYLINLFFILLYFLRIRNTISLHHYNLAKFPYIRIFNSIFFKYQIFIHDFQYFNKELICSFFNLNIYSSYTNSTNTENIESAYFVKKLLQNADSVVVPSNFVQNVLVDLKISNINKIKVYRPPFLPLRFEKIKKLDFNIPKIAFFGSFTNPKGREIILGLSSFLTKLNTDTELLIFGTCQPQFLGTKPLEFQKLNFKGEYIVSELSHIISNEQIDCIILPFQDPETFNFVFHELFHPTLKFFVSNVGIFTNKLDIPQQSNILKIDKYWDVKSWEHALSKSYFKL